MGEEWAKLINNLIGVSPYLAILILCGFGFVVLLKVSFKAQKELVETTIKTLTEDKEKFIKELREAYRKN